MRAALLTGLFLVAACTRSEAPPLAASPTPTPPPELVEGAKPSKLPDGRIEYHLVVRSDSGTIFLPLEVTVEGGGRGHASWVRKSIVPYEFDAATDTFKAGSGAAEDEYFDAVFPASPQELKIPVEYDGPPPAKENFRLRYRTMPIPDLATRTYVPEAIGDAASKTARGDRRALGPRLRGVDVFRWLASGFLLRDPGPVSEAVASLPGPEPK